jgi:tetratricopeptide (TPR) repeat protein
MRSRRVGLDDKELHWTNFNLGHVAQEMQNFPEAISYYKETERLREMYLPGDPLVAENYRRLGQCYQELAEYDLTISYYQKAENIYLQHGQMNHNLAQVYNSCAELYRHLQVYDTALSFSEKSLELTRETLGDKHPWLSTNLRNQAFYFAKLGDFISAKKCIHEALTLLDYDPAIYDAEALSAKDHVYKSLDMAGFIYLNHLNNTFR